MDQSNYGRRTPPRAGADPQLPNYMKSTRPANGYYASTSRSSSVASGGRNSSTTVRSSQRPSSASSSRHSGSHASSGGGTGNGGHRRRRPTRAQRLLRFALIILALLLVVVGILLIASRCNSSQEINVAQLENKTYFDGITIQGVDVSGKTMEQARGALQAAISQELSTIHLSMSEETGSWAFTSADMNISSNVEDVLLEAMAFGRTGTFSENSEDKDLLRESGKDFPITFTPSRDAIINKLNAIASEVNQAAIEPQMLATLGDDNKPVFELQEGQNGRMLDTEATADSIVSLVQQGNYQSAVTPVYQTLAPTQDTAFLQENTKFIAKYTTTFSNSSTEPIPNRVFNIRKAADIINGCVVQPGESWSFNGYVGLRTEEDGWKKANGISGGKEYTLQAGGGICQVSTTLYNALLCGNIEIVYRQKHSIPSDYVAYGFDATVDSSGIDLQFRNSTEAPLYIFVYITKNKESSRRLDITVALYGQPLPDGVTYKTRSEIIEKSARDDTVYIDDSSIPYGYQLTKVVAHDKVVAEAYLDKYVDGELKDSILLNKDTYKGNPAEIHVGTGDPSTVSIPEGAVVATVQPSKVPAYAPAVPTPDPAIDGADIPELEG